MSASPVLFFNTIIRTFFHHRIEHSTSNYKSPSIYVFLDKNQAVIPTGNRNKSIDARKLITEQSGSGSTWVTVDLPHIHFYYFVCHIEIMIVMGNGNNDLARVFHLYQ